MQLSLSLQPMKSKLSTASTHQSHTGLLHPASSEASHAEATQAWETNHTIRVGDDYSENKYKNKSNSPTMQNFPKDMSTRVA